MMTPSVLIAICASAALGAGAVGQTRPPEPDDQMRFRAPIVNGALPGFQRIDQGVEDLNALQTTLKSTSTSVDMRSPTGFKDVYRGPDGRMYRFDGAIGASFTHSEYYVNKEHQLQILIPGGTIFHIGQPWNLMGGAAMQPIASPNRNQTDSSNQMTNATLASAGNLVSTRGAQGSVDVLVTALPPEAAIVTGDDTMTGDAAYRYSRIEALLREASNPGPAGEER
jgi:hypothetical protein